jgi:hypothetical protein
MLDQFTEVWLVDFEFQQPDGERATPICMVAKEFRSGRLLRLWQDELGYRSEAPFDVGRSSLFVAFYSSAEMSCFLSLGWPLPERVLDLFVEFRAHTNGRRLPNGRGLLGAMAWFGLDCIGVEEKKEMQQLAIRVVFDFFDIEDDIVVRELRVKPLLQSDGFATLVGTEGNRRQSDIPNWGT